MFLSEAIENLHGNICVVLCMCTLNCVLCPVGVCTCDMCLFVSLWLGVCIEFLPGTQQSE